MARLGGVLLPLAILLLTVTAAVAAGKPPKAEASPPPPAYTPPPSPPQAPQTSPPPPPQVPPPPSPQAPQTPSRPPPEAPQTPPSTPGNSGQAPGHSGETPGNSGQAPGHSGETPGNSGQAPGHSGETPGHSGEAPGHASQPPPPSSGHTPETPPPPTKPVTPPPTPQTPPPTPVTPPPTPETPPTTPVTPPPTPETPPPTSVTPPPTPQTPPPTPVTPPPSPETPPPTPVTPPPTPQTPPPTPETPPPTPETPPPTPETPPPTPETPPPTPDTPPTTPETPPPTPEAPPATPETPPTTPEIPPTTPETPPPTPETPPPTLETSPPPPEQTPPSGPKPMQVKCSANRKLYRNCPSTIMECPDECSQSCFADCNLCKPVCVCSVPGACGDPRFIGGDGNTFYFHGRKDADFCVLSDRDLHINAHFIGKRGAKMSRDFTWIQAIGVLFDSHSLYVGAKKTAKWDDDVDRLELTLDGEPVHISKDQIDATWTSSRIPTLSVTRTKAANGVLVVIDGRLSIRANVVPITEEDSRVHHYGKTTEDSLAHLELAFKFDALTEDVHGVVGQTYRSDYVNRFDVKATMPTMGGKDSFSTSSLFAADCAVARFGVSRGNVVTTVMSKLAGVTCAGGIDGQGVVCKK